VLVVVVVVVEAKPRPLLVLASTPRCPPLLDTPLPCHPCQRARSTGQEGFHVAQAATGRRGSSLSWVTARG